MAAEAGAVAHDAPSAADSCAPVLDRRCLRRRLRAKLQNANVRSVKAFGALV
jgi:hypothetical protein